jgi:regulator of nucleoside diphosphate kinase
VNEFPIVMLTPEDAEALGWLLFDSKTHARIRTPAAERLTEKLLSASIVRASDLPAGYARLGSTIYYEELPGGATRSISLVMPNRADANEGRISVLTPIGCALLGHAAGTVVDVDLPTRTTTRVRIAAVERAVVENEPEQPAAA